MGLGCYPGLACVHGEAVDKQKLPRTDLIRSELWALLGAMAHPKHTEVENWSASEQSPWSELDIAPQVKWPELQDADEEDDQDSASGMWSLI